MRDGDDPIILVLNIRVNNTTEWYEHKNESVDIDYHNEPIIKLTNIGYPQSEVGI